MGLEGFLFGREISKGLFEYIFSMEEVSDSFEWRIYKQKIEAVRYDGDLMENLGILYGFIEMYVRHPRVTYNTIKDFWSGEEFQD